MITYNEHGYLDEGVHTMVAGAFLETFCDKGNRNEYKDAVINIWILQKIMVQDALQSAVLF